MGDRKGFFLRNIIRKKSGGEQGEIQPYKPQYQGYSMAFRPGTDPCFVSDSAEKIFKKSKEILLKNGIKSFYKRVYR